MSPVRDGLESSRPSLILDTRRIAYTVATGASGRDAALRAAGWRWVRRATPGSPAVYFPAAPPGRSAPRRPAYWGATPIWTALRAERELGALRRVLGGAWEPVSGLTDAEGALVAEVHRSDDGSVVLPFDPDAAWAAIVTEGYRATRPAPLTAAESVARRAYYLARGALPRSVQIAVRRSYSRVQQRQPFPRWPIEPALLELESRLLATYADATGGDLVGIGAWPGGHRWALVLTHDVETAAGIAGIEPLREIERALGLTSSWNFVPERYDTPGRVLAGLRDEGCEIGVHGLRHDGRDLASRRTLARRLPAIHAARDRWGAVGFRAPSTQRRWEWVAHLGFDYDSSFPDTDPYEPWSGGCCSLLPVLNGPAVELPITMPQDHTLFALLGEPDAAVWLRKAAFVASQGGMVLTLTHPDYAGIASAAYAELLAAAVGLPDAWHALPSAVSAWWRQRAASRPVRVDGGWRVVGPASGRAALAVVHPGSAGSMGP